MFSRDFFFPKDLVAEDNDLELLQQILELPDEDQPEQERPASRYENIIIRKIKLLKKF